MPDASIGLPLTRPLSCLIIFANSFFPAVFIFLFLSPNIIFAAAELQSGKARIHLRFFWIAAIPIKNAADDRKVFSMMIDEFWRITKNKIYNLKNFLEIKLKRTRAFAHGLWLMGSGSFSGFHWLNNLAKIVECLRSKLNKFLPGKEIFKEARIQIYLKGHQEFLYHSEMRLWVK